MKNYRYRVKNYRHRVGSALLGAILASALAEFVATAHAQPYVVGMNTNGFGYVNPDTGEIQGYSVELMNAIAEDAGFEVSFVEPMSFGDLIPALLAGDIDIDAGQTTITEERAAMGLLFSDVYAKWTDALIVSATDTTAYTSLEDLAGEAICGGARNIYGQYLARVQQERALFSEVVLGGGGNACPNALDEGRVKAILGSSLGTVDPGVRRVETYEPVLISGGGIAVRAEDTELMAMINASLRKLVANGTAADMAKRWGITPP